MDGPSPLLHQDGPNSSNIPNGKFMPTNGMMQGYNGLPPPNYYNGHPMNQMANMPPQHQPNMPSTSNGPPQLPPLQFPPQGQGFPSPMDAPNGNFYVGNQMTPNGMTPNGMTPNGMTPNGMIPNGMAPNGMMPQYNGMQGPPPGYFNGAMPPQMNGIPSTPTGMPNGMPPDYPPMPQRVPSSSNIQARASPFGQPPMHNMQNGNGPMTPTYGMPGQSKTPNPMFMGGGRTTPNGPNGFVFTTDMANQAATEVGQGKQQSIAQWHMQSNGMGPQPLVNASNGRRSTGARNSPSYTSAPVSRKRKGSQAQDRQNPTPSPHQPGSVPEFKQPMSNHAPGSVPDSSMMQFNIDTHKQIKTEQIMQHIKNEPTLTPSSATEHNPLKQMELMAKQTDNAMTPKLSVDQQLDLNSATKQSTDQQKTNKLARLEQIRKKIGMNDEGQQQMIMMNQYPANMRILPNGAMIPTNGPMPFNGMDMNGQGIPNGAPMPHNFPPNGIGPPPGYMPPGQQRFPMMAQPNGVMPNNGMRMPMYPMDMNMPRPPNCPPEMFNQWEMPQPLANLDSRVPSQKIAYYGNGNGQLQQPQIMPPASNTPILKNGT